MKSTTNPFAVTRAVDFTDREILQQWVNLPGDGVEDVAKPTSAMPMIILGGKGSGKTHLMRFLSTSVRVAGGDSVERLLAGRYLGIYIRCGGINASRFTGKGRSEEEWATVFPYYMDLTLAELALRDVLRVLRPGDVDPDAERALCLRIAAEFDLEGIPAFAKIEELNSWFAGLRRAIDIEVNNCALKKTLNVKVGVTPGHLPFAVPQALAAAIPSLGEFRFVYLIDELENLSEAQQVYVNSLVRENTPPCSVKVGARLYGLKTYRTLSSDEELKAGSEYERLELDEYLRAKGEVAFRTFAVKLCLQRLRDAGFAVPAMSESDSEAWFAEQFETRRPSDLGDEETAYLDRSESGSRLWIKRLHGYLAKALRDQPHAAGQIVDLLSIPAHPVVERVAIHVFYQEWYRKGPSVEVAAQIRLAADQFLEDPKRKSDFKQSFDHWKGDMLAQIARHSQHPVVQLGFPRLVGLAHGLPRHLLVILKHVFSWSLFRGERPFAGGVISADAQRLGTSDAAEWFFQDARMAGPDGEMLQTAISRIAELMRAIRFSDKPAETGVCTFSVDLGSVSGDTRRILNLAEKWSLIGATDGGRPDRNSFRVDTKYRLNPLLAVRWNLSTTVRGDVSIPSQDLDIILTGSNDDFAEVIEKRTAAMNGPHFGRRGPGNLRLPGME